MSPSGNTDNTGMHTGRQIGHNQINPADIRKARGDSDKIRTLMQKQDELEKQMEKMNIRLQAMERTKETGSHAGHIGFKPAAIRTQPMIDNTEEIQALLQKHEKLKRHIERMDHRLRAIEQDKRTNAALGDGPNEATRNHKKGDRERP
ncbi:hypothetical protein FA95DRAFT_1576238 [Auriscalpium vulgare]|uniref:Uncharacterized protein n=1 Tax=Auriscalpium vulgare TaxID=40419 RepID=A0ACB8RDE3_9AGAM|nr:hypothetical protein FA95DRAFT_1576238 [Auriscalpium vulgare]